MSALLARELGRVLPGRSAGALELRSKPPYRAGASTIVGPSGCGKSSLLYLHRPYRPTDIRANCCRRPRVNNLSGDERRQIRQNSVLFQLLLLPEFTALENGADPDRRLAALDDLRRGIVPVPALGQVGLAEEAWQDQIGSRAGERQRGHYRRALASGQY